MLLLVENLHFPLQLSMLSRQGDRSIAAILGLKPGLQWYLLGWISITGRTLQLA